MDELSLEIQGLKETQAALEKATAALNEQVFADPGLAPSQVTTLVSVLRRYRHGAGDF